MMRSRIPRRAAIPLVLLTFCSVVVACGEDVEQEASGGALLSAMQPPAENTLGNRAPEITSIRFEPANPIPGRGLTARVEVTDPDHSSIDLGYTWKINGRQSPFSGSSIDIPANLKKNDRIEVSVIATDGQANSQPTVQTALIGNHSPSVQDIQIHVRGNESGKMGHWIADPSAHDPDGDEISFRYSWIVNGDRVGGETAEFERASLERGDEIRLVVWATDGESESAPLESAPFSIENSPPEIESRPPAMDPSGQFAYAVRASDRDGDRGLRYSLEQGPDGMTIDSFSGELHWQATLQNAGEHIVEIAVDDRHGGVTKQTFYVQVATGPASPR